MPTNIGLLSGRVKKTPATQADPGRYDYLDLQNAEPDLGVPAANGLPLVSDVNGDRSWANVLVLTATQANIVGNLDVQGTVTANNFVGNVSGNIDAGGANTQVQYNDQDILAGSPAFTFDQSSNLVAVTGNVDADYFLGNIQGNVAEFSGNVTGLYFLGNGSQLTGIDATSIQNGTATVRTFFNANVTVSAGNVANLAIFSAVGANIAGNLSADYVFGNIDAGGANTEIQFNNNDVLAGSPALTFDFTANTLQNSGNITGNNLISNNDVTTATVTASGNISANNLISNNAVTTTTVTATSNITGNNLISNNAITTATVTATGNITGNNLISNNDVTTATVTATANITGNNITANNDIATVTVTASGNVAGVTFLGNVEGSYADFTGNITAANFIGNIQGNIDAGGANTQVQFNDGDILAGSAGFTFDKTSNLVTVSGNISAANAVISNTVTTANLTASSVIRANGGNIQSSAGQIDIFTAGPANQDIFIGQSNALGLTIQTPITTVSSATAILLEGPVYVGSNTQAELYTDKTQARIFSDTGMLTGNLFGSANAITIGNVVGNTTVRHNLLVSANVTGNNISSNNNIATVTVTAAGNIALAGTMIGNRILGNSDLLISSQGNQNITVDPGLGLVDIDTTSGLVIPVGNTAQRPGTAVAGTIRYNTEIQRVELYDGTEWDEVLSDVSGQIITPSGATAVFTLDRATTNVAALVAINGVVQLPGVAYSVSGNIITFAETPLSTDIIDIRFL